MANPRIDLTGKRFGKWLVQGFSHTNESGKPVWSCVCDCGNTAQIVSQRLRDGRTRSCGCWKDVLLSISKRKPKIDLHGTTTGYLTYMGEAGYKQRGDGDNVRQVLCLCACGKEHIVNASNYMDGSVISCGCSKKSRPYKKMGLRGQTYGRWTVLAEGKKVGRRRYVLCRCECGVERQVMTSTLRNGSSRSCGCLSAEVARASVYASRTENLA